MRTAVALLFVILLSGCRREPDNRALLCEVFADLAAVVATEPVEATPDEPQPEPSKPCCSECKNTGKVRSGDGLSWVDCDCEDSCGCHGPKSLEREVK